MQVGLLIRAVDWLQGKLLVNVALVLAYFIFIFYMHVPFARVSVCTEHSLTLPVYNNVVKAASIVLLFWYLAFIAGQFGKHPERRVRKVVYLGLILFFIILHFSIMFEMNIEIIHIFQYSILAFLLFPLNRRFGAAVCFAIPFMLVDEWNQYVNLYPGFVEYFEFNDVILDINGCALMVTTLYICGVEVASEVKVFWKRPEFWFIIGFGFAVLIAVKTCLIALYQADQCSNTWLVLNKIHEAPTFWRKFPGRDIVYHVMQPVEAIVAIIILGLLYMGLDLQATKTLRH